MLGLALSACDNPYAPENLGSFVVDLEITGTPSQTAEPNFHLNWGNPDGPLDHGRPLNPAYLPYTIEQVLPGRTLVSLVTSSNCAAEEDEKTINVRVNDIAEVVFFVTCQ